MQQQQGIGLLELMLAITIIAILLTMALRNFSITNETQKINSTIAIVQDIIGAESRYALMTGGYTNNINNLNLPANVQISPWGGTVTLNSQMSSNTTVAISIENVPYLSCNQLLRKVLLANINAQVNCLLGGPHIMQVIYSS